MPKTICSRCEVDLTKRRAGWEAEAFDRGFHRGFAAAEELSRLAEEARGMSRTCQKAIQRDALPASLLAGFETLPTAEEWQRLLIDEAIRRYGSASKAAPRIGMGKTTLYRKRRAPDAWAEIDRKLEVLNGIPPS